MNRECKEPTEHRERQHHEGHSDACCNNNNNATQGDREMEGSWFNSEQSDNTWGGATGGVDKVMNNDEDGAKTMNSGGNQDKPASSDILDRIDESMFAASGWNEALGAYGDIDSSKKARVVHDFPTFLQELLHGEHMDDVVVFRDGIRKLGMEDCVPDYLSKPLRNAKNVRTLLMEMEDDHLDKIDGHVYSFENGKEDEPVRKSAEGEYTEGLLEKKNVMRTCSEQNFYITELQLRKCNKYRHPEDNQYTRTILKRSVKDLMSKQQRDLMTYWDRYNEGGFVGSKLMGSPLHIDQCLWSNIGRNWAGYKVMGLWKLDDENVIQNHRRQLFSPPLSQSEKEALHSAIKIVLVRPGDMFLFSGANPHMAMVVSDQLSYTTYESFINTHPTHLDIFCKTNTEEHPSSFHMRESTLDDIKFEIIDQVNDQIEMVECGELSGPAVETVINSSKLLRSHDQLLREEIYTVRKHKIPKVTEKCTSPMSSQE